MPTRTFYIYDRTAYASEQSLIALEGVRLDEATAIEAPACAAALYRVLGGPTVDFVTADLGKAVAAFRAGADTLTQLELMA